MLVDYLTIVKLQYPHATDIVGLATEPGLDNDHSEDFVYLDASIWSDEENQKASELEQELISEGLLAKRKMSRTQVKEYPDSKPKIINVHKGSERNKPCPCGSGKKFKKCCGKNL